MALRIQAGRIPPGGADRVGDEPVEVLELVGEEDIRVEGPLHYELHVQVAPHEVVASGSISVQMAFRCVRCAEWFSKEIAERNFLCALEFTDDDESVDLTPEMREAIILALSAHPVCREDCRGLCHTCGRNLNKGECGCSGPADHRWSALDNLKIQE